MTPEPTPGKVGGDETLSPSEEPGFDLAAVRAQIPLLDRAVPMNACSQAPQTRAAREAATRYLDEWNERGMDWEAWVEEVEAARAAFARLVNAEPDEVAVTTSVSQATASLASALDFGGVRDTVVLTEATFPTVAHVWGAHRRYGADLRWVGVRDGEVRPADLASAVDPATRVVSVAHGYYQTGAVLDLSAAAEAAHRHGALLFVDAYQTLGGLEIDVKATGIDALASGTLKFLMGTPGIAFLYVRRELAESFEPAVTGWFGRVDPFAFDAARLDWADGARRFDTGTPPVLPAYVARAGLELIEETGPSAVEAWARALGRRLVEQGRERGLTVLGPGDPARRAPTTAFAVPDAHRVEALLRERRVIASARGPAIRLAPHFYNTTDDADEALEALTEVLQAVDE